MKNAQCLAIWISAILLIQCRKDQSIGVIFNPTDHPISALGQQMRLSIGVPNDAYYSFSADTSGLNCSGEKCKVYLASVSEMDVLALNLSDTIYFPWQFMTAESPYPANDCVLLLYCCDHSSSFHDYMCTIGRGDAAAQIIQELAKSFSGDARKALGDIVNLLSSGKN